MNLPKVAAEEESDEQNVPSSYFFSSLGLNTGAGII